MEGADRQQQNYHSGEPLRSRFGQEVLFDNPTGSTLDRTLGGKRIERTFNRESQNGLQGMSGSCEQSETTF